MSTAAAPEACRSAVVLFVRDEAADIRAWIAWHHLIGFDSFIIYDDDSRDGTGEILRAAARLHDIRLHAALGDPTTPHTIRQALCYQHALARYGAAFDWIGFFDADEYLLLKEDARLGTFLRRFPQADAVAIHWCNYGSNGHALKPALPPVAAYTRHGRETHVINRHVKSLVRPGKVGPTWFNYHYFDVDNARYVTAEGQPVVWSEIKGITDTAPDWSIAKLMHFQCRSLEHFVERMRKRPDLPPSSHLWAAYDVNEVEDRSPLALLPSLTAEIKRLETAECSPSPSPSPARQDRPMAKRQEIVQRLWRGRDPFEAFPRPLYAQDLQGWGSQHPYLTETITQLRPSVIVEIGVWKGGSTITMASALRALQQDGVVLSVDTWLGAWDHWTNDEWFPHLAWDHGYPQIQRIFMSNVLAAGLQDYVLPLPLDSLNAAQVLKHFAIRPDVIHLDGAHDFDAVLADLKVWWPLLRPGGVLIGDDYYEALHWPGVKAAFDTYFAGSQPSPLPHAHGKCLVRKPEEA